MKPRKLINGHPELLPTDRIGDTFGMFKSSKRYIVATKKGGQLIIIENGLTRAF